MATTQENFLVAVEVRNQQALSDLQAKLRAVEAEERDLAEAAKRGAISADVEAEATRRLTKERAALERQLNTATVATEKATKSTVNLGYAGMTAGRIFQDTVQGGIGGALNNIEGMTTFLGGTAGLAGALTGVGVTLFIFKDQIREVFELVLPKSIDVARDHLGKLQDRIKELEAKPVKLAVDTLELQNATKEVDRIKAALEAVKRLQSSQTEAEAESGKGIGYVLQELGGRDSYGAMRAQRAGEEEATSIPLAEARAEAKAAADEMERLNKIVAESGAAPGSPEAMAAAAAQKRRDEAQERARSLMLNITKEGGSADQSVGQILAQAQSGHGREQEQAQAQLAKLFGIIGRPDLAKEVQSRTPGAYAAEKQIDAQFDASDQAALESGKAAAAAAKQRDRQAKADEALTMQGLENQRLGETKDQRAAEGDQRAQDVLDMMEAWGLDPNNLKQSKADRRDQLTAQRLQNTARLISGQTGLQGEPLLRASERSVQLQEEGVATTDATQQAVMELMATMNGQGQRLQFLQQRANVLVREAQRLRRWTADADEAQSFLNWGAPGS